MRAGEELRQAWDDVVAQVRPYAGPVVPASVVRDVARLADRYLAGRGALFARRGEDLVAPDSLAQHLLALDAFERAAGECRRHRLGDHGAMARARRDALSALDHLEHAAVELVVLGGPSTRNRAVIARSLGEEAGLVVLSSAAVREELAVRLGVPAGPAWDHHVYAELLRRAQMLLELGESVVVDATWGTRWQREEAYRTASAAVADLVQLRVTCSEEEQDAEFDPWPAAQVVDVSHGADAGVRTAGRCVRPAVARVL